MPTLWMLIAAASIAFSTTFASVEPVGDSAYQRPVPARIMNGRVYNDSAGEVRAWASGTGYLMVPAGSNTGDLDVDHVLVCDQWYKIRYDGWVRVFDACKLSWLGTQCKADGPGQPCSE